MGAVREEKSRSNLMAEPISPSSGRYFSMTEDGIILQLHVPKFSWLNGCISYVIVR
jgi:hypothetical protein